MMFAGHRRGLAFRMKDGDQVVVGGAVDVYERDGRYQLYAKEITQEGEGVLYERFLALKVELEEMEMFAQEYKQPIPEFIRRLGVVTAPAGAAIRLYPQYFSEKKSVCPHDPLSGTGTGRRSCGQYCKGYPYAG